MQRAAAGGSVRSAPAGRSARLKQTPLQATGSGAGRQGRAARPSAQSAVSRDLPQTV